MTKFTFPSGSIEFELYIASDMDVYYVKVEHPDLEEPYEFEKDYPAFTKITEDEARKLFLQTLEDLLEPWVKAFEDNEPWDEKW